MQVIGGGLHRSCFDRLLVGLIEQHRQLVANRLRQAVRLELVGKGGNLLRLFLFALGGRQRCTQRFCGRRFVASLALLVEVHGRRVQANRERSRFGGLRCPAEVLAGQIGKTEFLNRADLPEKIRIELACDRLRVGKHDRWRGLGKPQQHIRRLDLHAFARHRLEDWLADTLAHSLLTPGRPNRVLGRPAQRGSPQRRV